MEKKVPLWKERGGRVIGAGLLIWTLDGWGKMSFMIKIRLPGERDTIDWFLGNENDVPYEIKQSARDGLVTPILFEVAPESQWADYLGDYSVMRIPKPEVA